MLSGIIGTAGSAVNTSSSNLAVDSDAVFHADAANNIAIGTDALDSISGDADDNIAIGVNAGTAITSGSLNVLIGTDAGAALLASGSNTAVGKGALSLNAGTANLNTCIGKNAGQALNGTTASAYNTLIGADAGIAGTVNGFKNNVVVGYNALNSTTTNAVEECVVIGSGAGTAINHADASGSVLVGFEAGKSLTKGTQNTAVGYLALAAATDDEQNNVAIGSECMSLFNQGTDAGAHVDNNVCVGYQAGKGGSLHGTANDFSRNVAVGTFALDGTGTTNVDGSVAIGHGAMSAANGSGSNPASIGIGFQSLLTPTTSVNNTCVGYKTMFGAFENSALTASNNNVCIGTSSGSGVWGGSFTETVCAFDPTTGTDTQKRTVTHEANANIVRGLLIAHAQIPVNSTVKYIVDSTHFVMSHNPTGSAVTGQTITFGGNGSIQNVAIGAATLQGAMKGADNNVCIGYLAGNDITTSFQCVVIGSGAGAELTTSSNTIAIGYQAMDNTNLFDGNDNIYIGTGSGDGAWATAESYANTIVGTVSCRGAQNGATYNTGVGYGVLNALTTADKCTAMGTGAGDKITTGIENTFIGADAGDLVNIGAYNTIIGALSDCSAVDSSAQIVIGRAVTSVGNNTVTIGHGTNTLSHALDGSTDDWVPASSDERLKENIESCNIGLAFINDLRPVTYNWKKAKDAPKNMPQYKKDSEEPILGFDYGVEYHGFIAQEVKKAIDKHDGIKDSFNMWQENENGTQTVAKSAAMPMVVKAIQELSAQIEELKSKIGDA